MNALIKKPVFRALTLLLLLLSLTISSGCTGTEPPLTQAPTPETSTTAAPAPSTAPTTSVPVTEDTESAEPSTQPSTEISAPTEPVATEETTEAPTETQAPTQPPETLPPETQPQPSTTPPEETQPPQPEVQSSFRIHFIDVGQADAALVECDGETMLIDGGNAEDSNLMYTYLKKHGIDHLDYVIGTHAHEDHIGGIAGALQYASVDRTYCPVTSYTTKAFRNFVSAVERRGSSITVPSVGDRFSLGSASCQIVGVNSTDETNSTSIVLRIVYSDTSFLFTGDAETDAEAVILDSNYPLRSTVLKVGHHGSNSSTGYRWLREVAPEYAVISVGTGNTYGHPTEEVLSRLRDADVTTFRTDLQGDIICTSDGKTVSFQVSRNKDADVFGGIGANSTQKPSHNSGSSSETQPDSDRSPACDYVLNTNSKKFHEPDCGSAKRISSKNRKDYHGSREDLIEDGYEPCKNCDP